MNYLTVEFLLVIKRKCFTSLIFHKHWSFSASFLIMDHNIKGMATCMTYGTMDRRCIKFLTDSYCTTRKIHESRPVVLSR
ncbi:hypothetical protein L1987_13993 [Smallanthus sonchifolius]|uniref:Uncharacterized protein n=1 Tax=Smallanthus sonchifolius TaxID=185202 RepID=A0ACB9JK59_9ASTR|nr:hypothetical protein L1987_13993 [Smallanthus sonchifolius]